MVKSLCKQLFIACNRVKTKRCASSSQKLFKKFDCTNWPRIELANIDFSKHEIIFIGSGDNVLFRSMNLESLMNKYKNFPNPPITILVKKILIKTQTHCLERLCSPLLRKILLKL